MKDHDLTLVGLTEDQQRLVLVSDAGEEFTLAADARLRAALRGEHPRLGQLETTMDSALRPRDIQARIRAGETPEQVADDAQTPLDRVLTYASPVLAERAHVADRAQRASVRRKAGDGPARVLSEAVAEQLRGRNLDPAAVQWDAWRREDGRWTLVADYRSGERARHAEFVFDAPGRYVVAEDDEARWLVGEPTAGDGPQPGTLPGPRRLNSVVGDAVGDAVGDDVELPLGADAIELVSEDPRPTTVDPLIEPEARAAAGQVAEGEPVAGLDAHDEVDQPEEAPLVLGADDVVAHPVELGSEADGDRDDVDDVDDVDDGAPGAVSEDPVAAEHLFTPDEEPGTPRKAPRRNRRPSVPSWDEIMFGGGKQE